MTFLDLTIPLLGIIQSFFEASMYVFVFGWTPVLHSYLDVSSRQSRFLSVSFLLILADYRSHSFSLSLLLTLAHSRSHSFSIAHSRPCSRSFLLSILLSFIRLQHIYTHTHTHILFLISCRRTHSRIYR